eukprot:CAMPEP_0173072392 /NCGR_PEP_ID=MMETSP1102-20130122/9785_1 /TAXON_ID=49646 /ORGANISM="Geminigera sp., Strain Caron Lab Isolate" /LENGTH=113 /DNA_ID=CAMNT_0013941043 /DNA_START=189 /DNA_END=531 /DNA_ORIENTATION=-
MTICQSVDAVEMAHVAHRKDAASPRWRNANVSDATVEDCPPQPQLGGHLQRPADKVADDVAMTHHQLNSCVAGAVADTLGTPTLAASTIDPLAAPLTSPGSPRRDCALDCVAR